MNLKKTLPVPPSSKCSNRKPARLLANHWTGDKESTNYSLSQGIFNTCTDGF